MPLRPVWALLFALAVPALADEATERVVERATLAKRCALAQLVAKQAVDLAMWLSTFDALYLDGETVRVLVTLDDSPTAKKLIRADETCVVDDVPRVASRGKVHVEFAGAETTQPRRAYLSLVLRRVSQRRGAPTEYEFWWPLSDTSWGNQPCKPNEPCVTQGLVRGLGNAPKIEIDILETATGFETTAARLTFARRSVRW